MTADSGSAEHRPEPGRCSADDPADVTLFAERGQISLPVRVFSRVRLVKYVETETVTHTVEIRRERLRVEEVPQPLQDGTDTEQPATTGLSYDWQPQSVDIVLHEEQVEISTRTVPVERIQVRTRVVTTDTAVTADLQREDIELSSETAATPEPL